MSRGDQRDRDRAKAQAKAAQKSKSQGRGGDPQKRNENDAAALQAKVAAKKALGDQQQLQSNSSNGTVPRKKVTDKKIDTFDDLLNAGLSAGKKGKIAA